MTEQEIKRLNLEFSNEFDVLYNNITSNLAPGLDEYEKSVFLTKAQDEIVKAYFNPKTNKVQEGFDSNERRLIDFSMIMKSKIYSPSTSFEVVEGDTTPGINECKTYDELIELVDRSGGITKFDIENINNYLTDFVTTIVDEGEEQSFVTFSPFVNSFFDLRDNTKSVALNEDILMFINEYVEVVRDKEVNKKPVRLTVLPINYVEYSRLMSKPHKRPLKSQAWRLLDNSNGYKKAELVIGPNDSISKYVIRYVKRPRAIRLRTFDDVTLEGSNTEQCCELDPILFPEIIQRACELAKAAYIGDLQSQVALGLTSQTNIGMLTQSR